MPGRMDAPKDQPEPPVTKYKHTFVVRGNTHAEIERELFYHLNGGYLNDSDAGKRDSFDVYGGRTHSTLEHTNPDMTPERYEADLRAWSVARRFSG